MPCAWQHPREATSAASSAASRQLAPLGPPAQFSPRVPFYRLWRPRGGPGTDQTRVLLGHARCIRWLDPRLAGRRATGPLFFWHPCWAQNLYRRFARARPGHSSHFDAPGNGPGPLIHLLSHGAGFQDPIGSI